MGNTPFGFQKAQHPPEFSPPVLGPLDAWPDSSLLCSTVDDNPDFDNLDIVARDEEERYFDEEEPEDVPSPELDGD